MSSANEWPMVRLGEVAKFIRGVTFKPADKVNSEDGIPVMRTKNVQASLEFSDVIRIPASLVKEDRYLRVGDTLVSTANSWNLVGKCCWVPELTEPTAIGGFVSALRATSEQILPRYLYYWFNSYKIQATVRSFSNQTTNIANLAIKRCLDLKIPLPPLPEQQRIAEILDNSLQLSEQIAIKITLLDEAEKSSYLSMFGAEPATTPTQELAAAHKGSMRTGPFGSQLKHEEFVDEGVAVLGLDNVVSNRFRWAEPRHITAEKYEQLKRYTVYSGDVLISIMGTTGRCVIVPENIPTTINTKHICAITTDHARMFPEFLRASFLWHPEVRQALRQQTKGAIMAGLNMGIIKKLALPVPDISRQQEWVSISKEFDTLREEILKQQSLAEELQNSFSTRAFTGQL